MEAAPIYIPTNTVSRLPWCKDFLTQLTRHLLVQHLLARPASLSPADPEQLLREYCSAQCTTSACAIPRLPGGSVVKNLLPSRRRRLDPCARETPWRRTRQPAPVLLPGESHGQGSLAGYSPRGRRVRHDWQVRSSPRNPSPPAPPPALPRTGHWKTPFPPSSLSSDTLASGNLPSPTSLSCRGRDSLCIPPFLCVLLVSHTTLLFFPHDSNDLSSSLFLQGSLHGSYCLSMWPERFSQGWCIVMA